MLSLADDAIDSLNPHNPTADSLLISLDLLREFLDGIVCLEILVIIRRQVNIITSLRDESATIILLLENNSIALITVPTILAVIAICQITCCAISKIDS